MPNAALKRAPLTFNVRAQIKMRYLIALLIASFSFAASFVAVNTIFCYSGFSIECYGPIWVLWLIPSFIGLFVSIISTGIQKIIVNPGWSKTLAIYTLVGICGPKAYLFITGSFVTIFNVGLDLADGLAGLIAGLVMEFMWHRSSTHHSSGTPNGTPYFRR